MIIDDSSLEFQRALSLLKCLRGSLENPREDLCNDDIFFIVDAILDLLDKAAK